MNSSSTEEAPVKYYSSRESRTVWGALVVCGGVIGGGSSIAVHSFAVTSSLLVGAVVVWYVGYWLLSKSVYYISADKAGFKDVFRAQEVKFDEIQSVTKHTSRDSVTLVFACKTRTVSMPLDLIDGAWYSDLKVELVKRNIPISSTAYGITVKET